MKLINNLKSRLSKNKLLSKYSPSSLVIVFALVFIFGGLFGVAIERLAGSSQDGDTIATKSEVGRIDVREKFEDKLESKQQRIEKRINRDQEKGIISKQQANELEDKISEIVRYQQKNTDSLDSKDSDYQTKVEQWLQWFKDKGYSASYYLGLF